eukprot:1160756-Pelagomonas_calceolata.AAC.5
MLHSSKGLSVRCPVKAQLRKPACPRERHTKLDQNVQRTLVLLRITTLLYSEFTKHDSTGPCIKRQPTSRYNAQTQAVHAGPPGRSRGQLSKPCTR